MAGLGFAAGGFADTFQKGQDQASVANYRTTELQLQQQQQQNAEKRQQYLDIDKSVSGAMGAVTETIEQMKIAGHGNAEIAQAVQSLIQPVKKLYQSSGRDPSILDAQLGAELAKPPKTQTESAMAAARVSPFQAAKPEIMGQNPDTGDAIYGTYNKRTQKFEPTQQPQGAPSRPAAAPQENQTPEQKGAAFLDTLSPTVRQQVQDLADYKINPSTFPARIPKGMLQSPRQRMIGLAEQYAASRGEQYDQTQFAGRSRGVQQFSGGPEARTVRSFNVLVSHLDVLGEATTALQNKDFNAFNALKNTIETQTGEPAPNTFNGLKEIVGDELAKAILGGAGALGDRDAIKSTISNAKSERQLLDLISKYKRLGAGQLGGLRKQYESTTGRTDFDRFLDKRTKKTFDEGEAGGGGTEGGFSGTSGPVKWRLEP